ncbi:Helicase conserved C-terminal domain-containing protein [Streptomyces sp. TLI_053]|uniref:DISARM system helicase DrmA n=1 Tax=Streptomyces sp. TLI_053 TaxID=1855352 RepID=UPI00087C69F5|nr:DISARM system helicase DrmA [Streptomyces sp. TLI_053]SDT42728.1 Helicase conserved C-terminal domain-containing protein [Streptomyces sp. TLI_053]
MSAQPSPPPVPHPFDDVPQTFLPGDSYDAREALENYITLDLLGPWDGDVEELPHRSAGPRDRYLVGMLGPRPTDETTARAARTAAQLADVEPGSDGDRSDSEPRELLTPQASGRIWASSMGLSFTVPAAVGTLAVKASWGRYSLTETLTEDGRTLRVWGREPVEHREDIDVTATGDHHLVLDGDRRDQPCVRLDVKVRPRNGGPGGEDLRVVEVALVNQLEDTAEHRDTNWLFQTRLDVTAFSDVGAAVFLPIDDPLTPGSAGPHEDDEENRLRLLYRDSLRHAVGRNVAVDAKVRPGERRAHRLTTTWLPVYDVAATTAPRIEEQPLLAGLELGMDELADLAVPARRRELTAALAPLADGYHAWLQEQRERVQSLPEGLRDTAAAAIDKAEDVCHRITFGIDALATDSTALEAFRFANRAMALQRRNTAVAAARAGHEDDRDSYRRARDAVREKGKEGASWRPFQLAFVLLNLASLSRPGHPDRGTSPEAVVDLLFFPTGGGKTEAYLGLAAYTFALRRLQGVIGTGSDVRSGEAGVGVLMRYTLRLLTAQQFQRAAALVAAAEVLRREAFEGGDRRWGDTPFRIGLWVGTSVSPNWFSEARDQIAGAKESADDKYARVIQVLSCPWCGSGLTAHRDMEYDERRRRVLLYCPRGEGEDRCPFSRTGAPKEGIPVLTVDEEIYRLAPAMLIATVDKLAQLPWNGYAGLLFGRVTELCPVHGYRHEDLDEETGCRPRHRGEQAARTVTRLRPPDLIIQDELHLISGALGTTVGLFEAAVDQLCSWAWTDGNGLRHEVGPKIVASTATTKRAADQVRGVFGRRIAVFPPQVLDVGDTFFSRQVEVSRADPGRRYLGVCAHGTRLKAAEIRVAEILLLGAQQLFDDYGTPGDPYMTLVGYFNATRELAGMRRYLDDDITTRVRSNGSRKGHRTIADRIVSRAGMLTIQELTSRISSSEISATLKRLEGGFDPERDTSDRRRALFAEFAASKREKRDPRALPTHPSKQAVDVVLATSMLQVGVDVSRFGLMLVVGQPKNTAEYIQASSRVGRDPSRPGLVVTLYNWSRPRDLAHFEDFAHYHATFYRQVEALSVTPFTRRALDRGTAPTYIAALRQAAYEHSRNTDAHTVDLDGEIAAEVERRLLDRAEAVGGPRARGYLAERIAALKDAWAGRREGSAVLGYRKEKKKDSLVAGLLRRADGARWDALTVPMSMRETENEINLLLPGGGRLMETPTNSGPAWDFLPGRGEDGPDSGVDADEYGDTAAAGTRKGQR